MALPLTRLRQAILPCSRLLAAFALALGGLSSADAQELTSLGVGNVVFADTNANGVYDSGEGVENVTVELWRVESPLVLVDSDATAPNGSYLLTTTIPGTYFVKIPGSQFALGGPLAAHISLPGASITGDDNASENGIDVFDLAATGVISEQFVMQPGFAPVGSQEPGFEGATDDGNDTNNDLTIDFGFYRPLGIGNVVFSDANGDMHASTGEGVPEVIVRLYRSTDVIGTAEPVSETSTDKDGTFYFGGLFPGSYKLHVPASMFAAGAPLHGFASVMGTMMGMDDSDQGIDPVLPATLSTAGVTTATIALAVGTEPTSANSESGLFSTHDDAADSDSDLTIDIGFTPPAGLSSVGNVVFADADNDGVYSEGEGVPGVTVQLFADGANPATTPAVAQLITGPDGRFLFGSVANGSYFLRIAPGEFAVGKPLFSALSVPNEVAGDDQAGEDGIDTPYPEETGIITAVFAVNAGTAPTDATTEHGFAADSDNFRDANVDLTHDFGFRIRAVRPLSVGNLVWNDSNHDSKKGAGESGIDSVTVQLFHQGQNPLTDTPVSTQVTHDGGLYHFTGLTPGRYFVHLAASNFQNTAPLSGLVSTTGNSGDNQLDDDRDENGIDASFPTQSGISSIVFELAEGTEPTEQGTSFDLDSTDDTNGDLTIDFAISTPCPQFAINPPSLQPATQGVLYSMPLQATGASQDAVWTVSGPVPPGISLTPQGVITGTPTVPGFYLFTVTLTETNGCSASRFYSMSVQSASTMGVGNAVYFDANNNGRYDISEGVMGVSLEIFREGDNAQTDVPVQTSSTFFGGSYRFEQLAPGRYFIHVPKENFAPDGQLEGTMSALGHSADETLDDNLTTSVNDNGIDSAFPDQVGVSSAVFQLASNSEPTDATGETGTGAADDNSNDVNVNMTIDFAFVVSATDSLTLGNTVFIDRNNNEVFDSGEGVDGVTVNLYHGIDTVGSTAPMRATITANGGRYLFGSLPPDSYKVHIPASEFASGKPLFNCLSLAGAGADGDGDDDTDENGLDQASPGAFGIESTVAQLTLGTEPADGGIETGVDAAADNAADTNGDLTLDLGFYINCPTVVVGPSSVSNAQLGVEYATVTFTAVGSPGPFTFGLASGELPAGMELNFQTGDLTGTPFIAGSSTFAVRALNALGCSGQRTYTINVSSPALGVGNLIFFDRNGNGRAEAAEGVNGVSVHLLRSDQDINDTPVQATTTTNGGRFLFDNLAPGSYYIHVPATMFSSGAPLFRMTSMSGELTDSSDDSVGENGQDAISPASTGVRTAIFALAPGTMPTTTEDGVGGTSDDARDADVDLTRDLGFVDATSTPGSFQAWLTQYGVSGGATGDADNDGRSQLLEYALSLSPISGVEAMPAVAIKRDVATSQLSVEFRRRRGSPPDVIYALQAISSLAGSPNGWVLMPSFPTITVNNDGTETVTFANVGGIPPLLNQPSGFVRLSVALDTNGDGNAEATVASPVLGWHRRTFAPGFYTHSASFTTTPIFQGTITSVTGNSVSLSASAGADSISTQFASGKEYYLEVLSGAQEGHRMEVDEVASSGSTITLQAVHARNTLTTALQPALIAIRPHFTIAELYPAADFLSGNNAATADQLQLWNASTSSFQVVYASTVQTVRRWINAASPSIADATVVAPGAGLFVRRRSTSADITACGEVRSNAVVVPLRLGSTLVGNPYPVGQSPATRGMTTANGFTGSNNATTADRLNTWLGDTSATAAYGTYYLLRGGQIERWVKTGETTDRTAEELFPATTSAFVTNRAALPEWRIQRPWTP